MISLICIPMSSWDCLWMYCLYWIASVYCWWRNVLCFYVFYACLLFVFTILWSMLFLQCFLVTHLPHWDHIFALAFSINVLINFEYWLYVSCSFPFLNDQYSPVPPSFCCYFLFVLTDLAHNSSCCLLKSWLIITFPALVVSQLSLAKLCCSPSAVFSFPNSTFTPGHPRHTFPMSYLIVVTWLICYNMMHSSYAILWLCFRFMVVWSVS